MDGGGQILLHRVFKTLRIENQIYRHAKRIIADRKDQRTKHHICWAIAIANIAVESIRFPFL